MAFSDIVPVLQETLETHHLFDTTNSPGHQRVAQQGITGSFFLLLLLKL